jgi:hypothetical protein
VGRNVDYIIEFGEPVVKIKGGGCYYDHEKGFQKQIEEEDDDFCL